MVFNLDPYSEAMCKEDHVEVTGWVQKKCLSSVHFPRNC